MIKPEQIAAKIYQDLVWHFTGKDNQLFLTFDDGPSPEITPWVLSVLKEHNAKATFFCIGQKVKENPELYAQIIQDGHSVGNHTNTHIKGWTVSTDEYYENVLEASKHIKSKLFRPLYGKIMPGQIEKIKEEFKIVMWDVLSKDYDPRISPEKCYDTVVDYAQSGSIVVFHDTPKAENNLRFALPKILKDFSDKGFSFPGIECPELVDPTKNKQ